MPARFSLAQVETAKANLEALPAADKDTREVGLQGAIKALAPSIRKLVSRGYSRQKIIELLREQGIPVSNSTLKTYLGEQRPKRQASARASHTSKAGETASAEAAKEVSIGSEARPAMGAGNGGGSASESATARLGNGAKTTSAART